MLISITTFGILKLREIDLDGNFWVFIRSVEMDLILNETQFFNWWENSNKT